MSGSVEKSNDLVAPCVIANSCAKILRMSCSGMAYPNGFTARTRANGQEAVRPLINVPRRMGLDGEAAGRASIADAVRRKGGDRDAREEEGRKEGEEKVVGRQDQAREQAPSPDPLSGGQPVPAALQLGAARSIRTSPCSGFPLPWSAARDAAGFLLLRHAPHSHSPTALTRYPGVEPLQSPSLLARTDPFPYNAKQWAAPPSAVNRRRIAWSRT